MSVFQIPFVFLLGAGASKPFGIPTTEEMASDFLKSYDNIILKNLVSDRKIDVEELIQIVQNLNGLHLNRGLSLLEKSEHGKALDAISKISGDFTTMEKDIKKFIRGKCMSYDRTYIEKIYSPLLQLQDVMPLHIFTTNYDIILESACNQLQIHHDDGFIRGEFDEYAKFDHISYGKSRIIIYKLHGSVNWWSDDSNQIIFRLGLDLEGLPKVSNLIIYPAQD